MCRTRLITSGRKGERNGQRDYEHLFPTALASRSLNRTDCAVTRDKLKKRPDEGKEKRSRAAEDKIESSHIFRCAGALLLWGGESDILAE